MSGKRRAITFCKATVLLTFSFWSVLLLLPIIHFFHSGSLIHQSNEPHVTLYRTVAYTNGTKTYVPVHGFVYEMHLAFTWNDISQWGRQTISAIVLYLTSFLQSDEEHFLHVQGLFLQFGRTKVNVTVQIANVVHHVTTDWDGYFHDDVIVDALVADPDGWLRYTVTVDDQHIEGCVQVYDETKQSSKISIISDIDDTIKMTNVTNAMAMIRNTFSPFSAIPKMAKLYQKWHDAKFHYVSSSPFQLYSQLEIFLRKEGFPLGSIHLRRVSYTSSTFFNIFKG
jgi:phosphatidate phosphatase APP1